MTNLIKSISEKIEPIFEIIMMIGLSLAVLMGLIAIICLVILLMRSIFYG